jgi:hypothetical protein
MAAKLQKVLMRAGTSLRVTTFTAALYSPALNPRLV